MALKEGKYASRNSLNVTQAILMLCVVGIFGLLFVLVVGGSRVTVGYTSREAAHAGDNVVIVYNKPPKTGSTSISAHLQDQLGRSEPFRSFHPTSNDYLAGMNLRAGATVFTEHRVLNDRFLRRLEKHNEVILVTSTRDPIERWLSVYRQQFKFAPTEESNWTHMEHWMGRASCALMYEYHTGEQYDCENRDKTYWLFEARKIVRRYDVVIDLEHLDQSSLVTERVIGVDMRKIPDLNVRKNEESSTPEHIMKLVEEKTMPEVILHNEMLHHLGITYSTLCQTRCYDEVADDPSACWQSRCVPRKVSVRDGTGGISLEDQDH